MTESSSKGAKSNLSFFLRVGAHVCSLSELRTVLPVIYSPSHHQSERFITIISELLVPNVYVRAGLVPAQALQRLAVRYAAIKIHIVLPRRREIYMVAEWCIRAGGNSHMNYRLLPMARVNPSAGSPLLGQEAPKNNSHDRPGRGRSQRPSHSAGGWECNRFATWRILTSRISQPTVDFLATFLVGGGQGGAIHAEPLCSIHLEDRCPALRSPERIAFSIISASLVIQRLHGNCPLRGPKADPQAWDGLHVDGSHGL
ncbi:hypothetical protein V8F06_004220 [Rhypophila decipiens]